MTEPSATDQELGSKPSLVESVPFDMWQEIEIAHRKRICYGSPHSLCNRTHGHENQWQRDSAITVFSLHSGWRENRMLVCGRKVNCGEEICGSTEF